MTKSVLTINQNESVLNAYKLMFEKNIRHLPVTDSSGIVVGILSDRDIQRAMVVSKDAGESEEIYLNTKKKVLEYMTVPFFSARAESTLETLIEEMMNKKISAVVIIDDKFKCIGIVTSNDIMRIFLAQMARNSELLEKPISFFLPNTLF